MTDNVRPEVGICAPGERYISLPAPGRRASRP